jgi:hypothetical protein
MTRCLAPTDTRGRSRSPHARAAVRTALVALTLAACDFPTAPPIFETRFIVPGENTTLSVDKVLPAGITVVGGAFRLNYGTVPVPSRSLGEMCGTPCLTLESFQVPKPAFTDNIEITIAMPQDVASGTVTSAGMTLTLTHSFGFDPLQPSGRTQDGHIAVTVRNGARVLGQDTIRGAFPSGSTLVRTIPLAAGDVAGSLNITLAIFSPAGGTAPQHWVTVRNAGAMSGTVAPANVAISEARVVVLNREVSTDLVTIDLTDIDESMSERVKSGTFVVTIDNPLGVVGTMDLIISGGTAGTITKPIQVATGVSTRRVEFTGPELRSLLGNEVTLAVAGRVTAPTGTAAVRPGMRIAISTNLDLVFEIGGSAN